MQKINRLVLNGALTVTGSLLVLLISFIAEKITPTTPLIHQLHADAPDGGAITEGGRGCCGCCCNTPEGVAAAAAEPEGCCTASPGSPSSPTTSSGDSDGSSDGGGCCGGCGSGAGAGEGGASCFAAGTPILMSNNTTKAIEKVQIGDKVMAFEGSGPLSPCIVTNVIKHEQSKVLKLNDILVTPEHRFLVENGEYIPIGDIPKETSLVAADGTTISDWSIETMGDEIPTYNLTVDTNHTYVAGGFRVHNVK